jgi:hypothetical protein
MINTSRVGCVIHPEIKAAIGHGCLVALFLLPFRWMVISFTALGSAWSKWKI